MLPIRTLQRSMERKAPRPNKQVPEKRYQEDRVMAVSETIAYATVGQVDEQQVRQRVDYLGGVASRIVVLIRSQSAIRLSGGRLCSLKYLFTPVQCRRDGCPVAVVARRRVRYGRESETHLCLSQPSGRSLRLDVLICRSSVSAQVCLSSRLFDLSTLAAL